MRKFSCTFYLNNKLDGQYRIVANSSDQAKEQAKLLHKNKLYTSMKIFPIPSRPAKTKNEILALVDQEMESIDRRFQAITPWSLGKHFLAGEYNALKNLKQKILEH